MLLGAAVAAGLAGAASAAPTFQLSATPAAYYAPADTGLAVPLAVPPKVNGSFATPGFYQIDFAVHTNGADATHSFGSIDWKYALNSLTTNSNFPDWQPDVSQVDTNGATKGGLAPLWDTNALFGTQPNADVINGVIVGTALAGSDQRKYVGQPTAAQNAGGVASGFEIADPTYLGSIYVNFANAVVPGTMSFSAVNSADRNNTTNAYEVLGGQSLTVPAPITFGAVPEPASLGLLAVGGLLAARRRRA